MYPPAFSPPGRQRPPEAPVWLKYSLGMTRKRTFSLPDDVSDQVDRAAGGNVSAFVTAALRVRLARDAAAERIRHAYGDPDPEAYAYWVRRLTPSDPGQQSA